MRYLFPLMFGLVGAAILVALGVWQVQRLSWKEGELAQIDARIAAVPVAIPAAPDAEADAYLPVGVSGVIEPFDVRILASLKEVGPVHRHITALETPDGRRLLLDLGVRPLSQPEPSRETTTLEIIGNLHWPDEVDSWTPEPDARTGLHFARDLEVLAAKLRTEPVLVVLRSSSPQVSGLQPLPVTSVGIPNDHLQYAVTWFGLALVWVGMTLYLLWRIRRRTA